MGGEGTGGEAVDQRLIAYDYDLPDDLIARHPPTERDGGRLMDLSGPGLAHRAVRDLPALLAAGDLLVINDTRVLSARLRARRRSGAAVEALLLSDGDMGPALVRPARRLKVGEVLDVIDAKGQIVGQLRWMGMGEDGTSTVACAPSAAALMAAAGEVPLPPYLGRPAEEADALRYQTVYAGPPGAVAAPTAGLHLTPALLGALSDRGVGLARLTLHVGAGTFRNLRPQDLDAGLLHEERFHISAECAAQVAATRAAGGRVVAVGTTSARALESAASAGGLVRAGPGATRIFIRPGYRFRVVDLLLTNLHLPQSSLLMMVSAFAGPARVRAAYAEAVAQRYRFFSYGDAMLLRPGAEVGPAEGDSAEVVG
ncbi:MAG: tRNA preQ1(34) S-adenosylmethionine ribosyltransferase-isomerase QueA [Deltaproteobacteria bacterium]|nr:tRNA preQ1(34) S-adenosylmethionine ribosyltransferase-isomerase QueA [Deltaproteobacteria bacterium]